MRLKLLAALFLTVSCWGAACVGSSGDWSATGTWTSCHNGVPGSGDTVTISDGATITVSDGEIVGTSPAAGNVVLQFGNTGVLVIAAGGKLEVRGDMRYAAGGGANTTPYLIVQGGGILEFDSSQAASPATTKYSSYPDGAYGFRGLVTAGTAGNHAIVRSNAGGGNGYFSLGGQVNGGSYKLTYTDFLRIGDAANPAFSMWSSGTSTQWIATHNTFTSCGLAPSGAGSLVAGEIFQHDYNVHTNSLGASQAGGAATSVMLRDGISPAMATGSVREIVGNVFDTQMEANTFDAMSFTIHSNYFGAGLGEILNSSTTSWALVENNFFRVPVPVEFYIQMQGNLQNNLWFLDQHTVTNPHGPTFGKNGSQTAMGEISDHAGWVSNSMAPFMCANGAQANGAVYRMTNLILLPNAKGLSSYWITAPLQQAGETGITYRIDHNTAIVTGNNGGSNGGPAVLTAHPRTEANPTGQVASYQNNNLWAPAGVNESYKLFADQDVNLNACAPANCNYNNGWNLLNDGGGFMGGANGYADNFSGGIPGDHDLAADPMFVDSSRNTATFDSAYLGNSAPAWSDTANYNVGDMVSSSDSAVYAGANINYRYVNGSYNGMSCAGQNTKPGVYNDLAHACWEWASLYRLRQGVAAQTLYEDSSIGVYGNDIITTLIQWIRAGFSPGNSALAQAGSDGEDIGAVPVTFGPPQAPTGPVNVSYTISGSIQLSGSALSGVTVALSGSQTSTATTDTSGKFTFSGLHAGSTVTVTPALSGFLFTPPGQTFTNLASNQIANFSASTNDNFVISGQVSVSGVGLGSATINVNGSQTTSTATDATGSYSIAVPAHGTYTIAAAHDGYIFSPAITFSDLISSQTANFAGVAVTGLDFYPVSPCRVVDTRNGSRVSGAFGPPSLSAGATRSFSILSGSCGIPSTAAAYSLNVTVLPDSYLGYLSIWPAGQSTPEVSTLNSYTGAEVANAAIVAAGAGGAVSVYVTDAADLLLDIDGYFAPPFPSGMQFYPIAPCRIADTRMGGGAAGPFGPPSLQPQDQRSFPIPSSDCSVPGTAGAYSLNFTVAPQGPLGSLTTWPTGQPEPGVSTLSSPGGSILANAAIVPAGDSGAVSVDATNATDVLLDGNGYFAVPLAAGLKFYPVSPCRVADTRNGSEKMGPFGPPSMAAGSVRSFPIVSSVCGIPSTAGAYSLNITAVPQGGLGALTTWPTGTPTPGVSTLNSPTGTIVANAAIVAAGSGGEISVYVTDPTDVLIDINGYFAP